MKKITIIGGGYVGIPLAKSYLSKGLNVQICDIDPYKVDLLNKNINPLSNKKDMEFENGSINKLFLASTTFECVSDSDAVIICVPTPIDRYKNPDISYVTESAKSIARYARNNVLISLESTTFPGTTEEVLLPLFESFGKVYEKDFLLAYSPEREDPGNNEFNLSNTPKVVSGLGEKANEKAKKLYEAICEELFIASSPKVAETIKLIENIQRSVNIGLMNEMKIFCKRAGINIFEVIDGAATKPFGFHKYLPGPGVGGHCIPIDPFYLTYKALEYDLNTDFINLAAEINESMPQYVIQTIGDQLNKINKSISSSKILCLGITYKKNVSDTRESPQINIIKKLIDMNATVSYSDPHHPKFPKTRSLSFDSESLAINSKNLSKQDVVVLLTDHDTFNYDLIHKESKILIDTRGKFSSLYGYENKSVIS